MRRDAGIEIEHELEILAGDGAALDFGQVEPQGGELGDDAVERARAVRQGEHQAHLICAGVNLRGAGDADEAGVVVVAVLNVIREDLQAIELCALPGGDGGDIRAIRIGHHLGRDSGIFIDVRLDFRVLAQKFVALIEPLLMRIDLPDILQPRALFG